jgi:dTDP-glucose 4,6-dehydratase
LESENIKELSSIRALRGKRIFLTGGTGLFGKWLLESIASLNEVFKYEIDLVVLSRDPQKFLSSYPRFMALNSVSFVSGDVRDFQFLSEKFDYVIHAATPVCSDQVLIDSPEIYSMIVDGTRRVLTFSQAAEVKRILYISSGAVYGPQINGLRNIPEIFPCEPSNAYGHGKLVSEQLCFDGPIEAVSARCFAFVGPYLPLDAHFAIGNFIGNCLKNEDIKISGDGTTLRSYMYSTDLVEWLLNLLVNGIYGQVYNVGSDQEISIQSLASTVRAVAGTKNKIIVQQRSNPSQSPARYIPSIQKAKKELGLTLKVDLQESVRKTIASYRGMAHAD